MNLLKLTLLFCFFTTILCGQQEYPGYVVLQEGDTLRGRIIVMPNIIKFKHEGVKTKYARYELADYGYYANRVFYSKPDEAQPTKKSEITGTIVLSNGDILHDFYIHSIRPDVITGYFEYPKYILYESKKGELLELTINEEPRNVYMDLIDVEDFPKKGDTFPMYAERIFSDIRAYNVSNKYPYIKVHKESTSSFLVGMVAPVAGAMIQKSNDFVLKSRKGGFDDWIINKNGKTYNINNVKEWKKNFDSIFEGDVGFPEYLERERIKRSNIEGILKAYSNFTS